MQYPCAVSNNCFNVYMSLWTCHFYFWCILDLTNIPYPFSGAPWTYCAVKIAVFTQANTSLVSIPILHTNDGRFFHFSVFAIQNFLQSTGDQKKYLVGFTVCEIAYSDECLSFYRKKWMFFDLISLWSPGVSRTLVDAYPTGDHDLYSRFLLECSFIRSILVICIINVIFLLLSVACVRMFFCLICLLPWYSNLVSLW